MGYDHKEKNTRQCLWAIFAEPFFADLGSAILYQQSNELMTRYGHEWLRQARLSSDRKRQKKTRSCPTKAERGPASSAGQAPSE